MKKLCEQLQRIPAGLMRNQRGVSVLIIVFVILVLTAIGYTFAAMMAAKQKSAVATIEASKAFHITEAGIQYGSNYLKDLADWSTATDQTDISLGGGSFTVAFSGYTAGPPETITATSTGTYGAGTRVGKATFKK
jgi:Tfp pilus assembly protein PilX